MNSAGRKTRNGELVLFVARSIIFNHAVAVTEMATAADVTKDAVTYAVKKIKDKIKKDLAIPGLNDKEIAQLQESMMLRSRMEEEIKEQKQRQKEEKRLREEQEKKELRKIRDREMDMEIFLRKQAKKMPNRLQISSVGMIEWNLQHYDASGKLCLSCAIPEGLPRRFPKQEITVMPPVERVPDIISAPPLRAEGTRRGRSRVSYMRMF